MKKLLLFFILALLFIRPVISMSQTFAITDIDASKFPYVKAGFLALDAMGNPYKNLSASDFSVIEKISGASYSMNPSLQVECIDTIIDPTVSVILVLDRSGSMDNILDPKTGEKRWDWVKQGATAFIKTLKFVPPTQAAIVSFAFDTKRQCMWTDSVPALLKAIDTIFCSGGTDYNPALLDNWQGAIPYFVGQPPKNRKIIVFLTDGEPSPGKDVLKDSIITALENQGAQFYAITVSMPMNPDLEYIAKASGGLAYAVYTKDALENIYRTIALDIQKKTFCYLTWKSRYGCDDASRLRDVEFTFLKGSPGNNIYQRQYTAPLMSIAALKVSENYVIIPDPPSNTKDITFTAMNSSFHVDTIRPSPPGNFAVVNWDVGGTGTRGTFDIDSGQSHTIRVQYNPSTPKGFTKAQLIVEGDPCPPPVTLVAGLTDIRILNPNGGEIFSTCDTVIITWGGISKNTPVNLSYSSDGGATWNPIPGGTGITGFTLAWIPPQSGTAYRIRGVVTSVSSYMWAKQAGGTENDAALSIAETSDKTTLYAAGYFDGTARFDGINVTSKGGHDIFLAKYYSDGTVAGVQTAGGRGNDSANGVCVAPDGYIYVTGVCYQGADFGSQTPTMTSTDIPYCFVVKYPPNFSNPVGVIVVGADQNSTRFQIGGTRIMYYNDQVYVQGEYLGYLKTPQYTFPSVTNPTKFTMILTPGLDFVKLQLPGLTNTQYSSDSVIDSDGNKYDVGSFSSSLSSGQFKLTSYGAKDAFIRKYGSTPGSADTSDANFTIEAPKLVFTKSSVDLGTAIIGHQATGTFTGVLCNTGTLPIKIINKRFLGANPGDFSFDTQPPADIAPGQCVDLSFSFVPQAAGVRSADLEITGFCADPDTITLNGTGVCSSIPEPKVDFGNVSLNISKSDTIHCALKNINTIPITIHPTIVGGLPNEFTIKDEGSHLLNPDSCYWVNIVFTPKAAGTRNSVLKYMPDGCGDPLTELTGEGVDTNIVATDVDFKTRRLKTDNSDEVLVINKTPIKAKITKIELESNDGIFSLPSNPAMPYDLNSMDTLHIPVNFKPLLEIKYNNRVIITIDSFPVQLKPIVQGDGGIPKFNVEWICANPIKPGETSVGTLTITNPSTTMPLHISKIDFINPSGEFAWKNDLPYPQNITIALNSSQNFEVYFKPKSSGIIANIVSALADNIPGPNPVVDTNNRFELKCEAIGLTVPQSLGFNNVLLCDDFTQKLTVRNTSFETPVTISGCYFEGADSVAFKANIPPNFVVKANETKDIDVTFIPEEIRDYSTKLHLVNTLGFDIVVKLTGSGKIVKLYSEKREFHNPPLGIIDLVVKADIPELSKPIVNSLDMEISYDKKMLNFTPSECFTPILKNNWTWITPPTMKYLGMIEVTGSGSIPTPFNGDLFNLRFVNYLSDRESSDIVYHILNKSCITPDTIGATANLDSICFKNGSLVVFGNSPYDLSVPFPNVVSSSAKITFGVGLDGQVTIELYNTVGEKVSTLVDREMVSGSYEAVLNTDNIPSGTYFIRMLSGPYIGQQRVIVAK